MTLRQARYLRTAVLAGAACLLLPGLTRAQTFASGWCGSAFDSRWNTEAFVEVSAGAYHTVVRRSDGSVVAWGTDCDGQCSVPALPAGLTYVEVATGGGHIVALRSDGSVVAWGMNYYGQCNVPAAP